MLYSNSAFGQPIKPPVLRIGNIPWPVYLFGNLDMDAQPFEFIVTNSALTANVVTLTVAFLRGGALTSASVPAVGAKAGVRGTTNGGGALNADPVVLTAVSLNSAGVGTLTYALTHANVTSAADVGQVVVQPYETADLVSLGSTSRAVSITSTPDESDNSRSLFAEAVWRGTSPTAATVALQVANYDDDSRYATIQNAQGVLTTGNPVAASGALATIASSAVTQSGAEYSFIMWKFIRAKVTAMTGGDGTTALIVTLTG